MRLSALLVKPEVRNLANKRSRLIVSKAFERSVNSKQTYSPSWSLFFYLSHTVIKECCIPCDLVKSNVI